MIEEASSTVEFSTVLVLLVGQLHEDALLEDELLLGEVVVSPDDEDDPPPLQEIKRRLKKINVRKMRSFFIYFP